MRYINPAVVHAHESARRERMSAIRFRLNLPLQARQLSKQLEMALTSLMSQRPRGSAWLPRLPSAGGFSADHFASPRRCSSASIAEASGASGRPSTRSYAACRSSSLMWA